MINSLFEKNENGKGFRSIGNWETMDKNRLVLESTSMPINNHQFDYAIKCIEKEEEKGNLGVVVVMKEAYSEKIRIHCVKSFAYFFLCNLASKELIEELDESDLELKNICMQIAYL